MKQDKDNITVKDSEEIMPKLVRIIQDKLAIDPGSLRLNASFSDDLNVDSLDFMELIKEIEEQFKIVIPDEEVEKMRTVGSMIEYLDRRI